MDISTVHIHAYFVPPGDCSHVSEYWSKFRRLVSLLHSLHLFHFTSDFVVSTVIENQVSNPCLMRCENDGRKKQSTVCRPVKCLFQVT